METLIDVLGILLLFVVVGVYIFFREAMTRWGDYWEKGKSVSDILPKIELGKKKE